MKRATLLALFLTGCLQIDDRVIADLERQSFVSLPCAILGYAERPVIESDDGKTIKLKPYATAIDLKTARANGYRTDKSCDQVFGLVSSETNLAARIIATPPRR